MKATHFAILAVLAGCAADTDGGTASFANASDAQRWRAFEAGAGMDARSGLEFGTEFAGLDAPTACPSVQTTGSVTVVTGGCTDQSGDTYAGTVTIDNLPLYANDPSRPSTISFDHMGLAIGSFSYALDGTMTIDKDDQGATHYDADLVATMSGIEANESLHLVEAADETTSPTGTSTIDIAGLGDATIDGQWLLDAPYTGTLTLHGAEDMVIAVDQYDPSRACVPYTIDGVDGTVCDPTFTP